MSAATAVDVALRPFRFEAAQSDLDDLRRRLQATRWPPKELVKDGSQGVQLATIQALCRHWATDYDWRKAEAKLNALPQFQTEIDGVDIHFIHVKSRHDNALPLLVTHGWPGSVFELLGLIGPLTDPTAHGGKAEDAFSLVLPSLPGYGFSSEPTELGWGPDRIGPSCGVSRRTAYRVLRRYRAPPPGKWRDPCASSRRRNRSRIGRRPSFCRGFPFATIARLLC